MVLFEPAESQITVDTLVVGGGIAGMTTAIETAEVGKHVVLVEKEPTIGGRVAAMFQYFPKLCPPTCGIEITLKLSPPYVNDKCTACGECEKVCKIERDNEFDYNLSKTKEIYLPHIMAYPEKYVIDPKYVGDERMKKCAEACEYGAIESDMQLRTVTVKTVAIVWATGWKPYDATKIDNLGFGRIPNVVTNVIMERIASESGPTRGKILRPSD